MNHSRFRERRVPSWLNGHIAHRRGNLLPLCPRSGCELLEIWFYGGLSAIGAQHYPYIVADNRAPVLILAQDPLGRERFPVFDGACHGYDGLFGLHGAAAAVPRRLRRYDMAPAQILAEPGYHLDYEREKRAYDFDEQGHVLVAHGRHIPWLQLKQDGIDHLALYFRNSAGQTCQFLDMELA